VYVDKTENISSQCNASATTFTVSSDYVAGSLKPYLNGVRLTRGVDFNEVDAQSFTLLISAPLSGEKLTVDYQYFDELIFSTGTLSTLAQIRSEGNLPDTVTDGKLQTSLELAAMEVRRLLGTTLYDTILAYNSSSTSAQQKTRTECAKAEALYALGHAIVVLNIETSGNGVVRTKNFGDTKSDLLSIDEARNYGSYFIERAIQILTPYVPDTDTEDDDMSVTGAGFRMSML
jgi:hypothetical protein